MNMFDIIAQLVMQGLTLGLIAAALIGALLKFGQVTFGAALIIGALLGILWKVGVLEVVFEEITQGI